MMSEPGQPATTKSSNAHLLPSLGLFTTTMLVAGGVIGSGIFRKPGVMAAEVGSPGVLLGVWLLAGIITLFGALTNAEIASAIPVTGGQYIFFDRIYGPFVAFLYGWGVFVVIQTGSIAAVCYVFAEHAAQLVPFPDLPEATTALTIHVPFIGDITPLKDFSVKYVAAAVIAALTVVNYLGVKFGGFVQNIVTLAKVAAMLLLVVLVFMPPAVGATANLVTASARNTPVGLAWWAAVAAALQGAFWAYDGWNKVTYIAGEVKHPQRNIPRALICGMLIVTAVYLLVNLAYAYVLPIDEMAQSKLVAAKVAEVCVPGGGRWVALAVMLSTFGAANAITPCTQTSTTTKTERSKPRSPSRCKAARSHSVPMTARNNITAVMPSTRAPRRRCTRGTWASKRAATTFCHAIETRYCGSCMRVEIRCSVGIVVV
jgi:APA family basic amino acid/polyamine antiporter